MLSAGDWPSRCAVLGWHGCCQMGLPPCAISARRRCFSWLLMPHPCLLAGEGDAEEAGGVAPEDLLEVVVGQVHEAADPDLIQQVPNAVAAREPARIAAVDDPLRPD